MRVGICLLTLVPGEMGGSETYARELVRGLGTVGRHDYVQLLPKGVPPVDGVPDVVAAGYRSSRAPGRNALSRARALALPGRLRAAVGAVDAVHYPLTVPLPRLRAPWATTLHDLLHLDHPELFPRAVRASRTLGYDRAAQQADAVIVVSEFVRERAVELLALDPGRVHVVSHGVDQWRFRPGEVEREPLLLYPARPWPHKNHDALFAAFRLLRQRQPDLRLVLTGGGHDQAQVPEGVEVRGLVTDDELAKLYRRAACLVFPSLYEGFGLPPLEAMASGCPVAAARAGAIPEVCGNAAVLFDPHDPEAIAAGIEDALARAEELRDRGLAHAALFTWEETARRHDEIYGALASSQ